MARAALAPVVQGPAGHDRGSLRAEVKDANLAPAYVPGASS